MNIRKLIEHSEQVRDLGLISGALGEGAAAKLKKTRDKVKRSIRFFNEVHSIYGFLKNIAEQKHINISKPRNGKTISVLLTSNERFNGGLDTELVEYFSKSTSKFPSDMLVIGSVGDDLLSGIQGIKNYKSMQFESDSPKTEEFLALNSILSEYSRILFFHLKFVTVVNQIPTTSDISPVIYLEKEQHQTSGIKVDYIVEPEIEKMLIFFENQIMSLLVHSIFLESEISRTAARMIAMDRAEDNAKDLYRKQRLNILRISKGIDSQNVLEIFSRSSKKQGDSGVHG